MLSGPGEPLGAFIAAYVGIELGHLVAGRTKIDLLVTPAVTILTGGTVGIIVGPPISRFMTWLGGIINWGTEQQPIVMGIVVSVVMGMVLTPADQFGSSGNYSRFKRCGGRGGHHWLLLSDGWFCCDQLSG